MKLLVGAVDSTYGNPLLSCHVANILHSYDCKDNADSVPVQSKSGNAPRLMQGTVSPGSLSRHGSDASRSAGQLSRGGSVPLVHEFSDYSDDDDEEDPLSAEQQLRRRLGQLGN